MADSSRPSDRRPAGKGGRGRPGPSRGAKGGGSQRGGPAGRAGRSRPGGGRREEPPAERATPPQWGSLARKGARRLDEDPRGAGSVPPERAARGDDWVPEEWIDEGPVRREAVRAVERGEAGRPARGSRDRSAVQDGVDVTVAQVAKAVSPQRAARIEQRLKEAARAFDGERYDEARRILAPLVEEAPSSAALRELNGLTLYRLGRWKAAAAELEVFRQMTGSTEQHPVLADCYRAQKRWAAVDELWEELRAASPGAALVTEGRIVAAGALADRRRLDEAIALLEKGFRWPKRPQEHHLRRAYALADLHERAGDVPKARTQFARIAAVAPDFADVEARRRALR